METPKKKRIPHIDATTISGERFIADTSKFLLVYAMGDGALAVIITGVSMSSEQKRLEQTALFSAAIQASLQYGLFSDAVAGAVLNPMKEMPGGYDRD